MPLPLPPMQRLQQSATMVRATMRRGGDGATAPVLAGCMSERDGPIAPLHREPVARPSSAGTPQGRGAGRMRCVGADPRRHGASAASLAHSTDTHTHTAQHAHTLRAAARVRTGRRLGRDTGPARRRGAGTRRTA